jgi:hypothetical protein
MWTSVCCTLHTRSHITAPYGDAAQWHKPCVYQAQLNCQSAGISNGHADNTCTTHYVMRMHT